jgi:hypothetical protein
LELGEQQSVADGDFVFEERLGHWEDEVGQSQPAIDLPLAFACADDDMCDVVRFAHGLSYEKQVTRNRRPSQL